MKKLENTIENKARFFAQYWGQRIVFWNLPERAQDPLMVGSRTLKEIDKNDYLELTPISAISDEHLTEAAIIVFGVKSATPNVGKSVINDYQKYNTPFPQNLADFFRKKSYAIAFENLEVSDLIDYNWIKLKPLTK